jgi:CheY-specific phosphatase CheX
MLGMPVEELGAAEVNDVVGELSNMIGGNFKSRLNDAGFSCSLSVPTVVRGDHLQIDPLVVDGGIIRECGFLHNGNSIRMIAAVKNGETES